MDIKELDNEYVAHAYGRFDVCLTQGKGSTLYDDKGKKYIDFGSGIGVTAFGICDEIWKDAVIEQLSKVQHTSNLYYTYPCAELAKLLCEKTGMKKVFFGNSGAEANEGAIKFARKYSFDKYGEGRSTIITLTDSFHGRTITTLAATGQDEFHTTFGPFTDGFKYCPANDCETLKKMATNDVCAIMFECIQGEGGVNNLTQEFVDTIAQIAKEKEAIRQALIRRIPSSKGYLTVKEAMLIYGISKDVLYRMIRQGLIPSYNFGQRLIRLSRQYMDEHFKTKAGSRKRKKEALSFEPKDCYTIGEIAKKFHINDSSVFKHIRRHSIPTRQIGNYVYVPKSEIDKLYKSL